jgi:NAD(P) transhydrogenase subunit alpha
MPVLAVTKERRAGETRVAVTPDAAKKLIALGFDVVVEAGAGLAASVPDADYAAAGAKVAATPRGAGRRRSGAQGARAGRRGDRRR